MNLDDSRNYNVVINEEGQYSIWDIASEVPAGWHAVGKSGSKAECLSYIKETWTDMRPKSLAAIMEARKDTVTKRPDPVPSSSIRQSLVERLSDKEHPLSVRLGSSGGVRALTESIHRGYVLVKFTDTMGGTELGVKLDQQHSDLGQADFDQGTGSIRIVGDLNLDGVDVRCVAQIDLGTLTGSGRLVQVAQETA